MPQEPTQASAGEIAVTPEMLQAGIQVLKRYISVDCEPIYSYEEVVEWIFRAMVRTRDEENSPKRH
jgi:hypothetical protein